MFLLTWWAALKEKVRWVAGAAAVGVAWQVVNEYLKARKIHRTEDKARRDEKVVRDKVESAESDWQQAGKKNDDIF